MKKLVLAAFAAGLIYSTIPAFADDVAASTTAAASGTVAASGSAGATAAVQGMQGNIGVDVSAAGSTPAEHLAFHSKLSAEAQANVKAKCKLQDAKLSAAEKAYCADIM